MRTIGIFLIVLLLISCEKIINQITDDLIPDNPPTAVKDSIFFHDVNPDLLMTSTLYYYKPEVISYCQQTPFPVDSTAIYSLDLNHDGVNDFEFKVKRWVYQGSGSSWFMDPCKKYQFFSTSIKSLHDANQVCVTERMQVYEFLPDQVISKDCSWKQDDYDFSLYYLGQYDFRPPTNDEFYAGVKIFRNNRYYYGWILVNVKQDELIIKEYAVNLSDNQFIKAGQKE